MRFVPRTLTIAAFAAAMLGLGAAHAADLAKVQETCDTCHGKDGASTDPEYPSIGGISRKYMEFNLEDYKARKRPCPETTFRSGPSKGKKTDMCELTKDLSNGDISALAKMYSGKKFVKMTQKFDPALAKKGKAVHEENCEKCHANDGTDVKDDAGMLAGQSTPYLRKTLQEYKAGKRKMEQKMQPAIESLDAAAIEWLLNYYASVK
jgi:sulfide dehydrogenase cytochrome subunit